MTSDDRFPSSSHSRERVDSLASAIVDGEIGPADVPEDLRDLVEQRVLEFSVIRNDLLGSRSRMRTDEVRRSAHISAALEASLPSTSSRLHRSGRFRIALAAAASIVAALAATVLVLGGSESEGDELVTQSNQAATGSFSVAPEPEVRAESSTAAGASVAVADASTKDSISVFSSIDEIARVARELSRVGSANSTRPMGPSPEATLCAEVSNGHLSIENALLEGEPVEIHIFADGGFIVYDTNSCTVVSDGTVAQTPP